MAGLVATFTFLFCSSITLEVDVSVTHADTADTISGSEGWDCCTSRMLSKQLINTRRHECENDSNKDEVEQTQLSSGSRVKGHNIQHLCWELRNEDDLRQMQKWVKQRCCEMTVTIVWGRAKIRRRKPTKMLCYVTKNVWKVDIGIEDLRGLYAHKQPTESPFLESTTSSS